MMLLILATLWLTSLSQQYGADSVGIYFQKPDGIVFAENADKVFHAASTMKVPVMMEVFRQVEQGKLKLDEPVAVKNQFASIVDGSPYSLSPDDDSDKEIYKEIGRTLSLRAIVERMINRSSNLATNIVIEKVNAENVMQLMKEIGARDMTVLRGVEDIKAYEAGKNNRTSARALAQCYQAILDPDRFSESSRKEMMEILLSQKHLQGISKGLNAKERGLKVASKDGWITEINHDSAIIEDRDGRRSIMVIMTSGVKKEEDGWRLIAAIAAKLYNE